MAIQFIKSKELLNYFRDQFKNIIKIYLKSWIYNIETMRQSTRLVVNPITVYSYCLLFNCTTVGQATYSMATLA